MLSDLVCRLFALNQAGRGEGGSKGKKAGEGDHSLLCYN